MEIYLNAVKSLPQLFWWKIKYKKCLKMPWKQSFAHGTKIRIKNGNAKFGKETVTRKNCTFRIENGNLEIGNKCFFNENVNITSISKITLGDKVHIGPNVVIVDHDHLNKEKWDKYILESIEIGNNVWIGANCVILRGSKIGDNSIIGAGSVVKGVVESDIVYCQERKKIEKKNEKVFVEN